jgi:hypothetical protein
VTSGGTSLVDAWLLFYIAFGVIWFCTIIIGLSILWPFIVRGAAWTPTPQGVVHRMLELAKVTKDDTVVDLGSGDGRIIIAAAREYGAAAIGIEVDPFRILWSRLSIRRRGVQDRVKVIGGNFFSQNLSKATVVTVFQRVGTNNRLRAKLVSELASGTRVVSYQHLFEDWTPSETTSDPDIYLYII